MVLGTCALEQHEHFSHAVNEGMYDKCNPGEPVYWLWNRPAARREYREGEVCDLSEVAIPYAKVFVDTPGSNISARLATQCVPVGDGECPEDADRGRERGRRPLRSLEALCIGGSRRNNAEIQRVQKDST